MVSVVVPLILLRFVRVGSIVDHMTITITAPDVEADRPVRTPRPSRPHTRVRWVTLVTTADGVTHTHECIARPFARNVRQFALGALHSRGVDLEGATVVARHQSVLEGAGMIRRWYPAEQRVEWVSA